MELFASILQHAAEPIWRQEEDTTFLSADSDDETFHVQADGFWGPEKGFHDAEQLRKQLEQRDQRS